MNKRILSISKHPVAYSSIFLIVAMVTASLYIDERVSKNVLATFDDNIHQNIVNTNEYIQSDIVEFEKRIRYLRNTAAIQNFVNNYPLDSPPINADLSGIEDVSATFRALMHEYDVIDQARILHFKTGQELVRMERNADQIVQVSNNNLQDKSARAYFIETTEIAQNEIYFSQINLNRENGEIQYPLKPTFRLAMQLVNHKGEKVGILLLNINAGNMLNNLSERVPDPLKLYLLNEEKQFLIHPQNGVAFSHELDANRTWDDLYTPLRSPYPPFARASRPKSLNHEFLYKEATNLVGKNEWTRPLTIIISIDTAIVNASIINSRINTFSLTGLLTLIVLLLFMFFSNYFRRTLLLAKARAEHSAIIDGVNEAIISINLNSVITSWNNASEQFFDCSRAMAVGKPIEEILTFPETKFSLELSEFVEQSKLSNKRFTTEYISSDSSLTLEVVFSHILTKTNLVTGTAIVMRDITEQVKVRRSIEESNEQLEAQVFERTKELVLAKEQAEQANTLKSSFISNVSHEMRTPLNGILGTLQLIKKEKLSPLQLSYLSMTQSSIGSLNALINDILDLSKIEAGKMSLNKKPFDLLAEFETAIAPISVRAQQKGLKVYVDTSELEFAYLLGDKHRITQIINNIFGNAEKFTRKGEIFIRILTALKPEYGPNSIEIKCSISDTGIGIAKENQALLFNAFAQETSDTSSNFGGTGLGLSVSKQICNLMHGDVWFESIKDQGSTFYFNAIVEQQKEVTNNKDVDVISNRVYLALHDTKEQAVISSILESKGYEVWLTLSSNIDIIIIDQKHTELPAQYPLPKQKVFTLVDSSNNEEIESLRDENIHPLIRPFLYRSFQNQIEADKLTTIEKLEHPTSLTTPENHFLSKACVLIVDDNDINIEVLKGLLTDTVESTFVCKDGRETIDLLKRQSKHKKRVIDLILLDCNMPVMDGFECTHLIRQGEAGDVYKNVPIIAVTADAMLGDEDKCINAGMDDYLSKPINIIELLDKLKTWYVPNKKD